MFFALLAADQSEGRGLFEGGAMDGAGRGEGKRSRNCLLLLFFDQADLVSLCWT